MASGNIKGITIEFRGDTTSLDKSMRQIKKDAKDLDAELKKVNDALKFDPKNVDLLKQKMGLLKDKISVTKDSLAEMKKEQAAMDAKGVDKTSQEYITLRQRIVSTEASLKGLNAELKQTSVQASSIGRIGEAFQNVGGKISAAGQALTPLSTGALKVLKGFFDAASENDGFSESLNKIKESFSSIVSTIVEKVMPTIQPIMDKIAEFAAKAAEWVAGLDGGVLTAILAVTAAVAALAPVLMAVGTAISAVGAAMSFLAANPIVAIIAAIAAVIAIIVYLIKHWDEVKAKATEVWEHIKTVFGRVAEFFAGLWDKVKGAFVTFATNIGEAISGAVKTAINGVITYIENTINKAIRLINGAIGLINKLPGVNIGTIGELNLPRLAKGGVLYGAQTVTLQAVLIFVSGRFTRIPVKVRLLIMSSALLADMLLIYFAVSPFMIILGSIFWNISFSVMLPTQREIVEKHIDPSVRNIAHNVADAAYNNFSAIIALSYSGILIDQFGVRMIAFAGILIMLVAVAIETAMLLKKENSKNKAYIGSRIMVSGQEG